MFRARQLIPPISLSRTVLLFYFSLQLSLLDLTKRPSVLWLKVRTGIHEHATRHGIIICERVGEPERTSAAATAVPTTVSVPAAAGRSSFPFLALNNAFRVALRPLRFLLQADKMVHTPELELEDISGRTASQHELDFKLASSSDDIWANRSTAYRNSPHTAQGWEIGWWTRVSER